MTMIAVYFLILNTFAMRYAKGEQTELVLKDNGRLTNWEDAFVFCKDQTLWKQLFNDCQPEKCNASAVADKILKKSNLGKQQYWIFGYVLRSPVMVNTGCFRLTVIETDKLHRGKFSLQNNSAVACSMACTSTTDEYIFLMGTNCLCITKQTFKILQYSFSEEINGACTTHCQGSIGDLCGGVSPVVGEELYTAYKIVNKKYPPGMQLGNTCASAYWDNTDNQHRFNYTRCSTSLLYVCQEYNTTSGGYYDDCSYEAASWYDARHKCHNKSLILTSSISNYCQRTQHWVGTHVTERIIWGNVSLPKDALCLTLVIDGSDVTLETENCENKLYSFCYTSNKQGSTEATIKPSTISPGRTTHGITINTKCDSDLENTKEIGRTTYGSSKNTKSDLDEENTNISGRTTLRGPVNAESNSDDDKPDLIPIVAGTVGGFVALVIVVIIVCIIQRRKKSNNKHLNTAVDEGEPETYSEPIKNTVAEESRKLVVENTIPEENTKLVNVTEEGIYNHLGDSEKMIEMKPQDSSIYDVTGDDEYHVFIGSGKRTIKDDDDLYDHGAASDVYNTLNDTVKPNRPESDTYNVINAK